MGSDKGTNQESVTVSMELTGRYNEVIDRLRNKHSSGSNVEQVASDISELLETVVRINGGTKSVIADEMPSDTNVQYDPQTVVYALQVLGAYELVALEGNTWIPGPAIQD